MEALIVVTLLWCAMGGLGWYVAAQKQREPMEGALLGVFFGPLGVLIVALLPTVERKLKPQSHQRRPSRTSWDHPEALDLERQSRRDEEEEAADFLGITDKDSPRSRPS